MKSSRKFYSVAVLFFISVFILSFAVSRYGGVASIENVVVSLGRPFYALGLRVERTPRALREFFRSKNELTEIVRNFERENRQLREEVGRLAGVEAENAALREALGDPGVPAAPERTVARIIGKGFLFRHEAIIDRGEKAGIRAGDAVLVGQHTLLGVVFEILPSYAKLRLVTHKRFRAAAATVESRIEGLVRGGQGGGVVMEFVPKNAALIEGDTVVTSGFDGLFPPGLVMGEITNTLSGPTDLFLTARILPSADIGAVEIVTVIHPPLQEP